MSKATPTPYTVNGFGGDFHVIARMQPHEVAISAKGERGGEIETAAFIVRACNSHDALLSLVERANRMLLTDKSEAAENFRSDVANLKAQP